MSYVVLDIETVPLSGVGKIPDPTPDNPSPFPPVPCHVPIVIGYMTFDHLYRPMIGGCAQGSTEREKLESFLSVVDMSFPLTLVTWNGRTFDIPVIVLRCFHYGLQLPWYYQGRGYRYRFSDEGHLDVMDYIADFGATKNLSLDTMAQIIGLPGKNGIEGNQVGELYGQGKIEDIEDYCMTDVAQTALIWLRTQYMRGLLTLDSYRESVRLLLERCEKNPRRYENMIKNINMDVLLIREKQDATEISKPDGDGRQTEQGDSRPGGRD